MIPIKSRNPSYTFPYVTIALIVINSFIYLMSLPSAKLHEDLVYRMGVVPRLLLTQGDEEEYQEAWDDLKSVIVGAPLSRRRNLVRQLNERQRLLETLRSFEDDSGNLVARNEFLTLFANIFLQST